MMRIFLHDFSGHPPQVRLSRELARRGHEVLHTYAADFQTPHGLLQRQPNDPSGFEVQGISLQRPFRKHTYIARQFQEFDFGRRLSGALATFCPDVAVLANTPLASLNFAQHQCRKRGIPFVFWLMDIYSLGIHKILRRKLRWAGDLVGWGYRCLEKRQIRASDKVISISEGFRDVLAGWGISAAKVAVMPLWAPLDEVPVRPKANAWSLRHGLATTTNIVYAGTLGRKHNPAALSALAAHYRHRDDIRIVVLSEGLGADVLRHDQTASGLDNLVLLPFQPFADFPDALGAADILLALLDAEAEDYCVPSKVLTNLCAGRAQVASIPPGNRAARVITDAGGGIVVAPHDTAGFTAAVDRLIADSTTRDRLGAAARRYAEREFDIHRLGDEFEGYLLNTLRRQPDAPWPGSNGGRAVPAAGV